MAEFRPTCRQCFLERGQTILLEKVNGEWVCPVNPKHKTKFDDVQIA